MRRLLIGEDVLAGDGSRLGKVERLVVDEGAHQVTAIVVDGRVVVLSHFRDAGPDGLAVDFDRERLENFPRHDDAALDPPGEHWQPPAGYLLSNFLRAAAAVIGQAPYEPPTHASLAPGASASEIIAGSPAWVDDRQVGTVEELFTNEAGQVAGVVLERGGKRYRLGIEKVIEVVGPNVHLDLSETDLELLEPQ